MTFRPRNAYYLRISTSLVLPLFLYLDERHIDWMSDVVLQHVLADLRLLVIPKLQAEKDVHFSSGATPGTKRGTVEVHRGESYQFAYFFRKTEPHTVLLKSRHFVTAPLRPEIISERAFPQPAGRCSRMGTQMSAKQSKRKRAITKGKRGAQRHVDEDEWYVQDSEGDLDVVGPISRVPRHVRKQRRVITDAGGEDDDSDADMLQDVMMKSPPREVDKGFPGDVANSDVDSGDAIPRDANNEPSVSPDRVDVELVVEEEEKKPKPLLKLKYQSFPISGHCLCVVVEPWPSQRPETRLQSEGIRASFRREILGNHHSNECVVVGQRAETPLFFPENDRTLSEPPFAKEGTIPPALPFCDAISRTEDCDFSDDELMNFSQSLNAAGHVHAVTADDDDDMDGAMLFGDADEVRELT